MTAIWKSNIIENKTFQLTKSEFLLKLEENDRNKKQKTKIPSNSSKHYLVFTKLMATTPCQITWFHMKHQRIFLSNEFCKSHYSN